MRTTITTTKHRVFVHMETTCKSRFVFGNRCVIGIRNASVTKFVNSKNKLVILVHDSNNTAQYSDIREAVERSFMKMTRTSKNNLMKAIEGIELTRRCTHDA